MPELKFGDTLDPVAVYAAIVSTIVFVWEVFKWWRGEASFEVSVAPDMLDINEPEPRRTFVAIEVRNTGNAATTITHVALLGYKSRLHRLFNKPTKNALVNSSTANRTPFELKPGGRFLATGEQNDLVVGWSQHYWLYGGVYHTMRKRPLLARIKPLSTNKEHD